MSSQRRKLDYGEPFERSVLKLMMSDFVFCTKAVELLKGRDFAQPRDWFFNQISEHFDQLKRCPNKDELTVPISRQGDADAFAYTKELEAICNAAVDEKIIKAEMTGFVRLNMFTDTAYRAVNLVNTGKRDEAYRRLGDDTFILNTLSFEREKYVGFGDGRQVIDLMKAQAEGAIPTGIRAIDEAMGGGMFPGTWTTFLGASNAGKSMINASLARFAAAKCKKTFVTIHEDELLPTKLRYLSCFSGIPYNKLLFGFYDLSPEEQQMFDDADLMLKEYVKFQFMYASESSVEAVCDAARHVMKIWPYDLYICDYGGCLTSRSFKDMSNTRLLQEHVHHQLKQLCLELNIPGAGGAQVNRDAMNKNRSGAELLRMTDVAEAIGIIKKSSAVITMNRSAKDIENNRIIFLLDKSRGGVTNLAVECVSDYSRCSTHLAFDPVRNNQTTLDPNAVLTSRTPKDEDDKKVSHG